MKQLCRLEGACTDTHLHLITLPLLSSCFVNVHATEHSWVCEACLVVTTPCTHIHTHFRIPTHSPFPLPLPLPLPLLLPLPPPCPPPPEPPFTVLFTHSLAVSLFFLYLFKSSLFDFILSSFSDHRSTHASYSLTGGLCVKVC